MASLEGVEKLHQTTYGVMPAHVGFAPGRVNIIGEHTDYNKGFVLPIAIKQGTYVAVSTKPSSTVKIEIISSTTKEKVLLDRATMDKSAHKGKWYMYVYGVIDLLLGKSTVPAQEYQVSITGDVPLGAGLSSSASIEVATGVTFCEVLKVPMDGKALGMLCVEVEHEYAGVMCGIRDQFASRLCKKHTALLLDCKTQETTNKPVELGDYVLLVTNSNAPHKLESSQYNERVAQCTEAVKKLNEIYKKNAASLREYSVDEVKVLEGVSGNRAKHVVGEDQRVMDAIDAMSKGDAVELGKLMAASHMSLKDLYEVSSKELDYLVENAIKIQGVAGSRLTGAGFGGCTVTLIKKEAVEEYAKMLENYKKEFNLHPFYFVLDYPEDGAKILI
uniref:Galactokinase, putative n=1 Tax=Entamoeba invadens TaxID=33085 RepID=S0AZ04_ENTIV|nr:galactokinase, putative [Entamoeba invadens]